MKNKPLYVLVIATMVYWGFQPSLPASNPNYNWIWLLMVLFTLISLQIHL